MERDSLIAHGTSFLLHDRLLVCSDDHRALVCARCRSLLAPRMKPAHASARTLADGGAHGVECAAPGCKGAPSRVCVVRVPYVLMYLANELAAMNVRTLIDVK